MHRLLFQIALFATLTLTVSSTLQAAENEDNFVPRRQQGVPGPPLSPQDAIAKMTVPSGFSVEVVASEPDIVNPVAMTFDEKGRIWVTESFEYPRSEPGPGRDRIKVLEDTDQDGAIDKVTVFAEGLNIPSGIAVGYGGVWVANAPDILFLQDTDGDLKADKSEVVVTGFGRTDTHELPNSLTWGPDGYLYGLNGVFNYSHVKHRGQDFVFTCAMFRIDPRTREFELFCEGTSNPWGIAFDPNGQAFVSACVIDHLWHLTESGYYHRQGGPYPPHTWKIESIVKHKHQMAAYCGIEYFDSDAYPQEYRDCLYMGNIHGGCVNVDVLQREGSTYFAKPRPDFLTANDVWHMPVDQKTGPDGCLYVLDWYDRYHCYQDARARPGDVDRLKGRLYRVRFENTPRAQPYDLNQETDDQLISRLASSNRFYRDQAQRVLSERASQNAIPQLESLVLDESASQKTRLHALWSLIGARQLSDKFSLKLLSHTNPQLRSWAVRYQGTVPSDNPAIAQAIGKLAHDESPDVRLQVATLAPQVDYLPTVPTLLEVLHHSPEDKLIPHIVWQNLHPQLENETPQYLALMQQTPYVQSEAALSLLPRAAGRILGTPGLSVEHVATLVKLLASQPGQEEQLAACLERIAAQTQSRELTGERLAQLKSELAGSLSEVMAAGNQHPGYYHAANLALAWNDANAMKIAPQVFATTGQPTERRVAALDAMLSAGHPQAITLVTKYFSATDNSQDEIGRVIQTLGKSDSDVIAALLLERLDTLSSENRPKAVEVLLQRPAWTLLLLSQIEQGKVPKDILSVNQLQRLVSTSSKEVAQQIASIYGTIKTGRDPSRTFIVAQMRRLISSGEGDPHRGIEVYNKLCGQCHKLHGKGQEVGPEITVNGRGNFEQLLSNVFDPSLVIGKDYQAVTVLTTEGRVLSGLLVEDSDARVVLKMQGGKLETVARDDVDAMKTSDTSLMPEGIEKQLSPAEILDLFAYLTLTKPPENPNAELISGAGTIDPAAIVLPSTAHNLLVDAKISTNVPLFDAGKRGEMHDPIFNPKTGKFVRDSQWHEIGVAGGAELGVLSEEQAVTWTATWNKPVSINFLTLSGTYPNQPQPDTAWAVEVKIDGTWQTLERGQGGWYDSGRFVWGWPGAVSVPIEALRVKVFSPDEKTPVRSVHFRGEEGFSWFAGNLLPETSVVRQ
ncbi:dehydrogenase [Blastopirellula marina]|uniref:Dehydrogenase n=1 Tax=Blastopirellula marina TaxID=124 RepID=A0A2S8G9I7_9BACT|nr:MULTISPECIES: PVC-type heme-binding CxxCH protein [Pirellulaceae]PQO40764.1 dehydrogenase [Blastopirellula marina]RCS56074.1 dehydrogenase [Bremerella cremea]